LNGKKKQTLFGNKKEKVFTMATAEQIFHVFEKYDVDGSGSISKEELVEALTQILGSAPDPKDIEDMMKSFDADGDGEIGLIEFACFAGLQNEIQQWKNLFNQVDTDGSGLADPEELVEVFVKTGSKDPQKDLNDMYAKSQKPAGEPFTLDEFVAAIIFGSPLKKPPLEIEVEPLSETRVAELQELFHKYDTNHDGVLSKQELKVLLTDDWKREPTHKEVKYVMKQFDADGNHKISKSEFIVMMGYAHEVSKFYEAFQKFDSDNNGKLEKHEVIDMLKHLGVKHPKKRARALMLASREGKRKRYLNFEHFLEFLLQTRIPDEKKKHKREKKEKNH